MVIDRVLLLLFFGITLGGTLGIICSAPHVFDFVDQEKVCLWAAARTHLRPFHYPLSIKFGESDYKMFGKPIQNLLAALTSLVLCSLDEDRLVADLFNGYNSLVRPVPNVSSPPVEVAFSLALVLLINVDEKNQIMHTNVWPTMRWNDYQMRWDPRMYGNIETIRVPPDKVWLPDIVLFNNADGNYLVSFYSNVVVEHTGEMLWVPPAVYKSSCIIDVEYFPFDEQVCSLTFGSWTFKKDEVQISYLMGKRQVSKICPKAKYMKLVFETPLLLLFVTYDKKTLFYTVILIMPTVLMAFLSMMVFYLPCEASEKITLAISILLALVVFLLLVSKILPPTSSTIPLMAKYLLLTFVMNMVTIMVTVVIINVYFRGPATHTMPNWVKWIFLKLMLLMMRRPESTERELKRTREEKLERQAARGILHGLSSVKSDCSGEVEVTDTHDDSDLSKEANQAIEAIEYITNHLTRDNDYKRTDIFQQCDEWKYVSMVLDRLLLYVFFAATTGGTMGVLFSAPNVFEYVDQAEVIENLKRAAVAQQHNPGL
ncbi:unnamed protein product [Angiostrongylus costaricensis]|uniref:Acetylcholine receptor subunit beta-type unc-29 n=1 Tax=Angiostrongylus costaricensis TaxID=334426 RepID=A0A158PLZ6_ANGCS|nr:unnamed protein product [Angiostrongylus costaricensis]